MNNSNNEVGAASNCPSSVEQLFCYQAEFQKAVTHEAPHDDVAQFEYHMTAMLEELGEVLKADKRWKTHRNERYEPNEKLDEVADMFITAINISLWSGFTGGQIERAIREKIARNFERLLGGKNDASNS